MREYQELAPQNFLPKDLLHVPQPSYPAVEEPTTRNTFAIPVFQKVHLGPLKTNFALAVAVCTLAIVFLVVQCGFLNRRATVSSSTRRRLAGDQEDGHQHQSIAPSACRDEALDRQHEESTFHGTLSPRAAELAAADGGIASSESFRKERKTKRHDATEASLAKLAPAGWWEKRALDQFESLLRKEAALQTTGSVFLGVHQPGTVEGLENEADLGLAALAHSLTSAVRSSLFFDEIEHPYSSGGGSSQQEGVELPIQAERLLQNDSAEYLQRPQSHGESTLLGPLKELSEMTQQLHWDAPSTGSASTGAAVAQSRESASPGCLPQSAAAHSTTGPTARVDGSPDQASSSGSMDFSNHLFYRLPVVQPLLFPETLSVAKVTAAGDRRNLAGLLNAVREYLVKKQLTYSEVQLLSESAGKLLRYVKMYMKENFRVKWPRALVEQLARRFLILDALLCTCEVTGEAILEASWWGVAKSRLLFIPGNWMSRIVLRDILPVKHVAVLNRFVSALEQYGQGRRPEAKLVVELKYEIFFEAPLRPSFSGEEWDPWRNDHIHSAMPTGTGPQLGRWASHSASGSSDSVEASREQVVSTDEAAYSQHAEYRLPIVQDLEKLEPMNLKKRQRIGKGASLGGILLPVRNLLLKSRLTLGEAQSLIIRAQKLFQFAFWKYRKRIGGRKHSCAARSLAARFWVADALWSTSEVLDNKMKKNEWWETLMTGLSHAEVPPSSRNARRGHKPRARGFVQRCIDALSVYRTGSRPRPSEVVQLKQIILAKRYIRWESDKSAIMP